MTADLTSRLEALEWERCTNYIRTIPGDFIVVSADSNWATDDAVLDGIVARHNATLKAPPSAIRENWPTQEELSAAQWIVTQVHRRAVWDQGDLDRLFTALHAVNRCGNTYAATNAPPPEEREKK